jgi:hypothetical protein
MHGLIIIIILSAGLVVGCQNAPSPTTQLQPEQCVEVGTVTAHGVWSTKKQLARAGIPAYTVGSQYPLPYRILVPPSFRQRAMTVLRDIEQRPESFGYGITHE